MGDVVVAIPARDEESSLGRCLESVLASVDHLAGVRPRVRVVVVVALDRCWDASAAVARRYPVVVREVDAGSVGAARRVAVGTGLEIVAGAASSGVWVAGTDADCVVPPRWLAGHLDLADAGHDLVVGTVEPDGLVDPALLAAWHARHELRDGHRHVHGANLGVRADAYREVGGFTDLAVHEDVALVAAVRDTGRPWVATDRVRVRTSGRPVGRVDGGFASYLGRLRADEAPGTDTA